jgi:hypothetical protein
MLEFMVPCGLSTFSHTGAFHGDLSVAKPGSASLGSLRRPDSALERAEFKVTGFDFDSHKVDTLAKGGFYISYRRVCLSEKNYAQTVLEMGPSSHPRPPKEINKREPELRVTGNF